jgi:hypothetical protein
MVGRCRPGRPPFSRRFGIRAGKSSLRIYFGVLPTWRASQPGHRIGQTPVPPSTRSGFASRPRIPGFLKAHVKTLVSVAFSRVPNDPLQVLLSFPGVGSDGHRAVHFHVTTDPRTDWTAQQLRDAVRFDRMQPLRDRLATSRTSRLLRGCSRVGLQKGRQECADGREQ